MKKILFLLFGVALSFTSCQNEDNVKDNTPITIKAGFDDDSRTFVDTEGKVKWEYGDQINVYYRFNMMEPYKSYTFTAYTLQNDDKLATFQTEESCEFLSYDEYVAVYPVGISQPNFDMISHFQNIKVTLPSIQKYEPDKMVSTECNPAVAIEEKSDFENSKMFHFKNICGLLKLQLKGDALVYSITLNPNSVPGQSFSGDFTYDKDLFVVETPSSESSVTLDCGGGVQLDPLTPTVFYIALPPGNYNDFKIQVDHSGMFTPKVFNAHSHQIQRSKIHTIEELDVTGGM